MLPREVFCKFLFELGFVKSGLLSDGVTEVYVHDNNPIRVKVPKDVKFLPSRYITHQIGLMEQYGFGSKEIDRALAKAKSKSKKLD